MKNVILDTASKTAVRLMRDLHWARRSYEFGHRSITQHHNLNIICNLPTDYLPAILLLPSLTHNLEQSYLYNNNMLKAYTDGSKCEEGVGAAFHVPALFHQETHYLGTMTFIFQAEMFAIVRFASY